MTSRLRSALLSTLVIAATSIAAPLARAAEYPTRAIKLVVPYAAGGPTDVLARLVADYLGRDLKQTTVVENKPGAQGAIAAEQVARAEPDGYTLFVTAASIMVLNPLLYKKLPYDPQKDLRMLTVVTDLPVVMEVHPSVPAKTVKEFVAYAKANPGKLNFGSAGTGGNGDKAIAMPRFDLSRRLFAEALGSALLVATVVGSGIMAETLTRDMALALLCNTLPTGAILVVLISILSPISGAHFNPAVTLVFALRREIAGSDAVFYMLAQIAGALAGTLIAHLMFAIPIEMSLKTRTGSAQWFAETVATFGLVAIILAALRFQRASVPWLVGLYITAAYWFTASTSFANPAVAIARAFSNTFSGIRPIDLPGAPARS